MAKLCTLYGCRVLHNGVGPSDHMRSMFHPDVVGSWMLPLSRSRLLFGGWASPSHRSFPTLVSCDAKDHMLLSQVPGP